MIRRMQFAALAVGLAVGFQGKSACADPPAGEDPHCRAGNPQAVACWAIPSNTKAKVGYYVGGGCAINHLADPRCLQEGTWGWDYGGCFFPRRVMLGWWHGRCYQGGTEGYKSDGPHLENPCNKPE